jgi:hypothetical protein
MNSLSYIVYTLQIVRVAIKTQSSINIEKVFRRLSSAGASDQALIGAVIGAFVGVSKLKHQSPSDRLSEIMSSDRVKGTVERFISVFK